MADGEQLPGGWLPPQAPGGGDSPPRFAPPAAAAPPPERPAFVTARAAPSAAGAGGRRTDPLAIASLLLSLAGLALLVLSLGLGFFFALPCALAGWLCAVQSRRRLAADPALAGDGLAHAGRIASLIALVLGLVAMVVWIVLLAGGFSLEEFRQDLERELERRREQQRDPAAQEAGTGGGPLG